MRRHDTFCSVCGTPFQKTTPAIPPATYPPLPTAPADAAPALPIAPPQVPSEYREGVGAFPPPPPTYGAPHPSAPPVPVPVPPTPPASAPPAYPVAADSACTHCGAAINRNDIFCGACGNVNTAIVSTGVPFPDAPTPYSPPPQPSLQAYDREGDAPHASTNPSEPPARTTAFPAQQPPDTTPAPVHPPLLDGEGEDTVIVERRRPVVSFTIELSTGQTETITGSTLIGRNPRADVSEAGFARIVVIDPTRSVSKTHGEFSIVDGGLYYRDRRSANGSEIVTHGEPVLIDPEQWFELSPGSEVNIGDQKFTVI